MSNILITGANRGLGLALVELYLARDDRIFAGCRNPDGADALKKLAQAHPGALSLLSLDVQDQSTIISARAALQAQVEHLDMLINNAAINLGDENLPQVTASALLKTLEVNAVGPVLVAQAFLDLLKAGHHPKVINISSEAGSITRMGHFRGYGYYGSKAALNMYTRSLALDPNLKGIIVIAMHPGWVRTDMGGSAAPLSPAASAQAILQVVDRLTSADSGKFLTYQDEEYPW